MIGLVLLVMGGIYAGWFTPTESGAIGALGALVLAIARRRLTLVTTWRVLTETGYVTVSILFLIISANIYSRLLAFPACRSRSTPGWRPRSSASIPADRLRHHHRRHGHADRRRVDHAHHGADVPAAVASYDVNMIWFGIITVIAVEIGLLTPPFGLSVLSSRARSHDNRITLNDIFTGAAPYAVVMFLVLLLIIFVPSIALVLL